ncbi:MAG: GtrA family protein [Acidobacteria bacterium]|nr:GtrA family protein [Acidobacteriota bacterium]
MSRPSAFMRWMKFNGVGAVGFALQLSVLAMARAGLGLNYLWATALAVEAALLHNFFWHEKITWRDRESSQRLKRLIRFHLANGAISLVGNVAFMRLLAGTLMLNYLAVNVVSTLVCSLANFYAGDLFVFARSLSPPDSG